MVVVVTYYKKSVLVTGAGTFDVKDELKGIGGNYNRTLKGWVYSKSKRDAVVTKLRSLPGVDLVDETAAAADPLRRHKYRNGALHGACLETVQQTWTSSSHVTLHREFHVKKLYGLLAVNVNNRDFYVTPVRDDRDLPVTTLLRYRWLEWYELVELGACQQPEPVLEPQ